MSDTYTNNMTGGALVVIKTYWAQIDGWRRCACGGFSETMTGGGSCGGNASVDVDRVQGGAVFGGNMVVHQHHAPYEHMTACYPLDDAAAPYVDHSRFVLDGAATKPPELEMGAGCQLCQQFAGAQSIQCPSDELKPSQPFSVSCWAWFPNQFQAMTMVARGNAFTLGRSPIATLYAQVVGSSGTTYQAWGQTMLDINRWYHCAAVWIPNQTLTIYLNGNLEATTPTPETSLAAGGSNFLGCLATGGGYLTGNLQEVRIYGDAYDAGWWSAEWANYCTPGFLTLGW
jgi:hypothetical protein